MHVGNIGLGSYIDNLQVVTSPQRLCREICPEAVAQENLLASVLPEAKLTQVVVEEIGVRTTQNPPLQACMTCLQSYSFTYVI